MERRLKISLKTENTTPPPSRTISHMKVFELFLLHIIMVYDMEHDNSKKCLCCIVYIIFMYLKPLFGLQRVCVWVGVGEMGMGE